MAIGALSIQHAPNLPSLLRVGEGNPLRHEIEAELGPLAVADSVGHDAQLYYLVARDPFARGPAVDALVALDSPRYRYRRILVPLLAGGLGQFPPRYTLIGLIVCAILGMSLVSIGVADLAFRLQLRGGAVFLALMNLGALVSVMLLTVDVMALGLGLVGITLAARGLLRRSILILSLAVLTKETYWLVPVGLAAWLWSRGQVGLGASMLLLPGVPLACWSQWLLVVIPGGAEPRLLGKPFAGGISGVGNWLAGGLDHIQTVFALYVAVSFALVLLSLRADRSLMLRCLMLPWLLLGAVAGPLVWWFPTNMARAFPILWSLGVLALLAPRRSGRIS